MSVRTVNVNASSIEDALEQSGMTWMAEQSEMINAANGKVIEDKKVIFRSDNGKQIGCVGSKYGVINTTDCFSFFNVICQQHHAKICNIYEYNGGATIHLKAKVKDKKFDAKIGDECGFQFDLFNSFDGLHRATINYGILRLVCLNGLVMKGKDANTIEIRHTKNAVNRLDEAAKVWAGGEQWYNFFIENVKILNQKMVNKKIVDNFLDSLFGKSDSGVNLRKKEKVEELFETGLGNDGKSMWSLYNGLTDWVDHYSRKDEADRIEYANLGAGHQLKAKAFELALNM